MEIKRQVEIMEKQIHSPEANFTLMEKMAYLINSIMCSKTLLMHEYALYT